MCNWILFVQEMHSNRDSFALAPGLAGIMVKLH